MVIKRRDCRLMFVFYYQRFQLKILIRLQQKEKPTVEWPKIGIQLKPRWAINLII